MVEFKSSETRLNLMRAFAGESQARNRYTIAAQKAIEQNQPVLHDVFIYTANQEREHAEVFYNYLKQMTGEKITISGDHPIDNYDDIGRLLRAAQQGETDEYENVYKYSFRSAPLHIYTRPNDFLKLYLYSQFPLTITCSLFERETTQITLISLFSGL